MNPKLMTEFEEFEGLGNQIVDETTINEANDEDDQTFRPVNAASLTSNDIYYEVSDMFKYFFKRYS